MPPRKSPATPEREQMAAELREQAEALIPAEIKSKRGRRRGRLGELETLTPIRQVRRHIGGAAAYYLNPNGATIREVFVTYPNGNNEAGRFSKNAAYYRERQREKGLEYIGPRLTPEGVARGAQVIDENRADYLQDLNEQIQDSEYALANASKAEDIQGWRHRINQLQRLKAEAEQPFDTDDFLKKMDDILRAQELAQIDPDTARAIKLLVGDRIDSQEARVAEMAQTFKRQFRRMADPDDETAQPEVESGTLNDGKSF